MLNYILKSIEESINIKNSLKKNIDIINSAAKLLVSVIKSGGKILICGNGGSATDAQHMAGELVGRFEAERNGIPAIALTPDSALVTAVSNDYGFEHLFSRQVTALGQKGDALIGITTSGNSKNIVNALKTAKDIGLYTIAMTGENGGNAESNADIIIKVPSKRTCRIQEAHITIIHILCGIIENLCTSGEKS
jgi:phosphoheptose isomerase